MAKDFYDVVIDNYSTLYRSISEALHDASPCFEIVTFEQFKNDAVNTFDSYDDSDSSIEELKDIYNAIKFPTRATRSSAGYDFKSPFYFYLNPGESIMIPTGIRAYMPHYMTLLIFPRSGLGTKYRMCLANSTAVIDSDYYNADNEGHILLKVVNDGKDTVSIEQGQAFAQGVFTQYFTVHNDHTHNSRIGGLGSTDNR